MQFKGLKSGDIKELVNIFISVYNDPPWNDKWEKGKAETYLCTFIENPSFIGYTAYQNSQLVGACLGEKRCWCEGDEYFINEIFIANSAQRQGVGTSFVKHIQQELKQMEIRTITLLTDRDSAADCFYKSIGFKNKEIVTFKFKNY